MHLRGYIGNWSRAMIKRFLLGCGVVFCLSLGVRLSHLDGQPVHGWTRLMAYSFPASCFAAAVIVAGFRYWHYQQLMDKVFGKSPNPRIQKPLNEHWISIGLSDIALGVVATLVVYAMVWASPGDEFVDHIYWGAAL